MKHPQAMTWGTALADFARHQQAAGRSPGTIRLYRYRLLDLADHAKTPAAVTADLLEQLLAGGDWMPETRKSVRTAYRAFFGWAARTARLPADPSAALPQVSVPPGVPRPTPEKVLRATLRVAQPREQLMVMLGAYAGLRCCEIACVHADQWDGTALTVRGKGGRTRRVPIVQPQLVERLDDLRGVAFPNRWTGNPLTPGHVSRLLSRALTETWTGHTLRHRFGTRGLAGTRDLLAVGRALGHSRPETTQRYCELEDERLLAVAQAAA